MFGWLCLGGFAGDAAAMSAGRNSSNFPRGCFRRTTRWVESPGVEGDSPPTFRDLLLPRYSSSDTHAGTSLLFSRPEKVAASPGNPPEQSPWASRPPTRPEGRRPFAPGAPGTPPPPGREEQSPWANRSPTRPEGLKVRVPQPFRGRTERSTFGPSSRVEVRESQDGVWVDSRGTRLLCPQGGIAATSPVGVSGGRLGGWNPRAWRAIRSRAFRELPLPRYSSSDTHAGTSFRWFLRTS
jgi:hypothetical protein